MHGHERDFLGLALVVAGLLLGGAIAAEGLSDDITGPVGGAVADGAGALLGRVAVGLVILIIVGGVAMLRGHHERLRARLIVGGVLGALSLTGFTHLAWGPDSITSSIDELSDGGGIVGSAVWHPIKSLIGTPGAWVLLVAVGFLASLILSDRTVAQVFAVVGRGLKWFAREVAHLFSGLFDPGERGSTIDLTESPEPFAATEPELEPEPQTDPPKSFSLPAKEPEVRLPTTEVVELELDLDSTPVRGEWKLPPMRLLETSGPQSVDEASVREGGKILEEALASHGVKTRVIGMTVGPTVTRYELELAAGVKVARVTSLNKDIAYAMASADVRILAPIPGKSAIGVEVPNRRRDLVCLGDVLSSREAQEEDHPLTVGVGRDIAGRPMLANLAKMPHLLIAGATGAGKSSCINSFLTSILMRATPDQVRLILIDPKRVELNQYDRLPHLITQVVTDPKKAANALNWVVKEMERRYDLLSKVNVRDITGYNDAFDAGKLQPELGEEITYDRLPFIVVIVDELNDLMMVAARDVEASITRIAQMARAVGIHLVLATQRPSVNVITGVIKANVPSRLAFAVSSLADSRVILDQSGAERLIGQGDMLLLDSSSSVAERIQGCWVTEAEVAKVTAAWREQTPNPSYVKGVEGSDEPSTPLSDGPVEAGSDEDLAWQALQLVVRSQMGSTSMLQRKLRVGFARAGRLMDDLEQRGIVGPSEGSKPRNVLMSVEELESLLDSGEQ